MVDKFEYDYVYFFVCHRRFVSAQQHTRASREWRKRRILRFRESSTRQSKINGDGCFSNEQIAYTQSFARTRKCGGHGVANYGKSTLLWVTNSGIEIDVRRAT